MKFYSHHHVVPDRKGVQFIYISNCLIGGAEGGGILNREGLHDLQSNCFIGLPLQDSITFVAIIELILQYI